MGRETAIDRLAPEHLELLKQRLEDSGFRNYQELTDWLTEMGYEISKSSVHRFGKKHEQKIQAVSLSTQAAIHMAERNPDDAGALSSTVITMMQSEFFNALVRLQSLDDDNVSPMQRMTALSKISKGIAELSKASVNQKKWQVEVREKTKIAADEVQDIVKSGGLSDETADLIRSKILGIAHS
ncbi:DUF3486 family protein [Psychrobacter lutiphocae]|uniref:DUF3486 family protein n=1 Tax=Psychrobacter lutiphocae TaxID=540500 RepID=UPI000366A32B|nr:DUF3486 family protein [Psychrobacter lutiphocae]